MKAVHPNLTAALEDPTGLAVLGVFFDVSSGENDFSAQFLFFCRPRLCSFSFLFFLLAGCLRGQRALWAHIPEAVLCGLQRSEWTSNQNQISV